MVHGRTRARFPAKRRPKQRSIKGASLLSSDDARRHRTRRRSGLGLQAAARRARNDMMRRGRTAGTEQGTRLIRATSSVGLLLARSAVACLALCVTKARKMMILSHRKVLSPFHVVCLQCLVRQGRPIRSDQAPCHLFLNEPLRGSRVSWSTLRGLAELHARGLSFWDTASFW
jgi:hypothetical protein